MVVPDMFHNHGFGYYFSRIAQEVFQQGKFQGLELDFFRTPIYFTGDNIEAYISAGKDGGLGYVACPADQGLYAGQQLRKGKRLGHVVVTAGLEPLNAIVDIAFGA